MKSRLVLLTTWLNSDPRRVRVLSFAIALALAVLISGPQSVSATPEATSGS